MEKAQESTPHSTNVYLIVCKTDSNLPCIAPYTFLSVDEAENYYEQEYEAPDGILSGCKLVAIMHAFTLENGKIVWVNREPVGEGDARYLEIDNGLHEGAYVNFRHLLFENQVDLNSMRVVRVY